MKKNNAKKLAIMGCFCAIAYICVFVFRIKVSFLTFDAKDAVIAVCALLYGPVAGVSVSAVTSILEFLTVSDTGVYGLIMNIISTTAFILPVSIIYKLRKNTTGAISGLIVSVFSVAAVMLCANLLITPYYMGVSIEDVKGILLPLILPFNATKAVLNGALTMIIYKPIVNALRSTGLVEAGNKKYNLNKKTIIILVCSAVLAAVAIIVLTLSLGGVFEIIRK